MKKILSIFLVLTLVFGLTACGGNTDKGKDTNTQSQTETETDLTTYVKGLKDWTVEVNSKNVDFMKDVTFDEKVIKEVTADDSKVDLTKEGTYELVYNILPVDKSISEVAVKKTVTVKVVSVEEAQKESDAGNQVVTSDNVIKKDSNGNTPAPKTDTSKPSNNDNSSSSKPSTGNSGSSSSSKPSTGSGSSSGSNSKPSTGGGSSSGNSGNSGSNKPHQHNYSTVVSSTNGDCSHKGKVTKKCSCGATITVDGNYGSHNWKDSYKEVYHEAVTKPVYAYCYVCNGCGAQFKDENDMLYHDATACGSGYSYKEWVDHEEVVTPAWTESVYNGKDCTICGQHSN